MLEALVVEYRNHFKRLKWHIKCHNKTNEMCPESFLSVERKHNENLYYLQQ